MPARSKKTTAKSPVTIRNKGALRVTEEILVPSSRSRCARGSSSVSKEEQKPATRSICTRASSSVHVSEEVQKPATRSRCTRGSSSVSEEEQKPVTISRCTRASSSVHVSEEEQKPATRLRCTRGSSSVSEEEQKPVTRSRCTRGSSSVSEEEQKPAARSRIRKTRSVTFASQSPSPKKARTDSPSPAPVPRNQSRGRPRALKSRKDKPTKQAKESQDASTTTDGAEMQFTQSAGESNEDDRPKVMKATVKAWRTEKIYLTKSVAATQEKIQSQKCVCVVGVPGAGKSTAIRHAALSLEREGFIIYLIHSPEEFLKYFDEDKKQVFILDDVLGIYSLKQTEIEFWAKHNNDIGQILGRNTKLLVSIRNQLYNQAVKDNDFVFLDKATCIDFCDQIYTLQISDMIGMLTHNLTVQDIDNVDDLIRKIWYFTEKEVQDMDIKKRYLMMSWNTAGQEFSHCFPLLCKVFCSEEFVRQDPEVFFLNPFQALTKIFQNIRSHNKLQFCGLVLCTVFDGKLTEDMFSISSELDNELDKKSLELRNVIMTSCDLEGPKYLPQIKSALNSLDGVYVSHVENSYQMAHRVFHDVVTYLFNDTDPSFVFKYGTSVFINDRVRLCKSKLVDDPYMIIINDDKNIERLADRLLRDLKCNAEIGASFIVSHPNIDDDRLLSCLRSKLSGSEQTDKKLIDELFRECMWTVVVNDGRYEDGNVPHYNLIEFCVQTGVDCNMYFKYLYPLHISVMSGSVQLTQLLLRNGADKRLLARGLSVLWLLGMKTKYNKLALIKFLTEDREDHSAVSFITSDRHQILQELYDENLQLEEVLSDNSINILTTDKHRMKHYVENYTGKLQLVKRRHDNILTSIDIKGRNILHYLTDDRQSTCYLLSLKPDINEAINQRDLWDRTPYWFIVNKQHPIKGEVKLDDKDREDMIQLYKDNHAIL